MYNSRLQLEATSSTLRDFQDSEDAKSKKPCVNMGESLQLATNESKPDTCTSRLSEENLRIHNAACPKNDGYFQMNLIREERARAAEYESYRQIFGELNEFDGRENMNDMYFDVQDQDIAIRRAASLEVLKLYSGSFASLSTPMDRFLAISPTQDTHTWMAKGVMEDVGIATGDMEALDLRKLASEMVDTQVDKAENDTKEVEGSVGSLRHSSDTLSVSRFRDMKAVRKEGARNWKRIGMRRRSTIDKGKIPRSCPYSTAK